MLDTILDEKTETTDGTGSPRVSHYVNKDEFLEGLVNGVPVIALCGKIWIPTQDGEKFPKCSKCVEIYEQLVSN
jgi:hypothetical protein